MGVDKENKLNKVYRTKYRIKVDYQILPDHGAFYPQALYNDLVFELTLTETSQVVKGFDMLRLKYTQTNIQLEYEMIAQRLFYWQGIHVRSCDAVIFKKETETRISLRVKPQRHSLKAILLLFMEPYSKRKNAIQLYIEKPFK